LTPHHLRHHSILHLLHHPKILNKPGRHRAAKEEISSTQIGSPFEPKKMTAGTAKFLSGIALSHTTRTLDLAEHEKLAKKPKVITVSTRKPTMDN
jgi:hypothetical protein